ncbi:MAG: sugar ABC transporter permease [Anaerolineae bacterium]|nr:sugar ABC transporter permease [Anaerolineae bacterium]MDQ7037156.1 sugar ABC transporter permease [Anaerolineae bacterium]
MLQGFRKRVWEGRWGYFFIAPAMIPFLIFTIYPLIQGIMLSFYKAGVNRDRWEFIGITNYTRLLTRDPVFPTAIKNTFVFVLGVVPAAMIICLFVAVLIYPLSQRKQTFFRAAFYMPVVSAGVVLAMVWVYMYSQEYGLLNYLLDVTGILDLVNGGEKIGWLAKPNTALMSLAIVVLTWSLGQPLILFLAGLGAIPEVLYDAAKIDGATAWQSFWRITLPLLRPTILFVLVVLTIAVFQVFVVVQLMTLGGPANATQTIVYRIWVSAFTTFKFGYASAMAVILLAIVSVLAIVQFKLLDKQLT